MLPQTRARLSSGSQARAASSTGDEWAQPRSPLAGGPLIGHAQRRVRSQPINATGPLIWQSSAEPMVQCECVCVLDWAHVFKLARAGGQSRARASAERQQAPVAKGVSRGSSPPATSLGRRLDLAEHRDHFNPLVRQIRDLKTRRLSPPSLSGLHIPAAGRRTRSTDARLDRICPASCRMPAEAECGRGPS